MSFAFDFQKGDFVVVDGKVQQSDGIKMWIEKILRTEKRRFLIYEGTSYGVNIEDLVVGANLPPPFVESELKREIEDALTQHPKIAGIKGFEIIRGRQTVVKFEVINIDKTSDTFEVAL